MQTSKTQAEFDIEKWLKSECAGYDMCGEFDFCAKCNKEIENPCAVAYDAFNAVSAPKKPETKKPAAKTEAAKPATAKATTAKTTTKKAAPEKPETEKAPKAAKATAEKKTTAKPKAKKST